MQKSIQEIIKNRRSVRTFDGEPISQKHLDEMNAFLKNSDNPFHIPVEFHIFDAKENGLTSPVIVGANAYLCAKIERVPNFEMAFGYSFEKACLYACSIGLGTVMLASTLNRPAFEKALNVKANEVMPVASPIGYPAKKMSVREGLMRTGTKADKRKPFQSLYFNKTFSTPLNKEDASCFAEALDLARWAPSAVNAQPWRAVLDGDMVHFYEVRSMKDNPLGDIQKVDIGIMLSHFEWVLNEQGLKGSFISQQPQNALPEKTQYMITFKLQA